MWPALLAASLFPSQVHLPFPDAARVVVVGRDVIAISGSGKGVVLAGDGKGHFRPGARFEAGDNPASVAAADLDGDGKPDLVVANHERKYLTVLFGPLYAKSRQVPIEVTPHGHFAAVADLDGDGKQDLVVNDMGGRRVLVLWGNGDGSFTGGTAAGTGSKGYPYINVAVAGRRIFAPTWPQPQLAVLRVEKRELKQEALLDLPNPSFFAVAADFDGDGKPDVAVATYSGNFADASRDGVVFFSGGHSPAKTYASGHAPTALAAGDIDGDGRADLAVCNQAGDSVTLLFGESEGLREGPTLPAAHPQGIALGDLDGDGKADLVVAARDEVIIFLTR